MTDHPANGLDDVVHQRVRLGKKGYEGKRPRTWVTLTAAGQAALRDEITHLKQLIQQVEQPETQPTADR
jgi:hypothetical protein